MTPRPLIALFTDFGLAGPYIGQMRAVLHEQVPEARVITLMADLPAWDIQAAAYLLAAHSPGLPEGTVFLAVVDPGVGGDRRAGVLKAGAHWFVGPDEGLFEIVRRRAAAPRRWSIDWQPDDLSTSFHGRDLFAPVAARLARGEDPPGKEGSGADERFAAWPDDLARVIYVDHFGNAVTGLRADALDAKAVLLANRKRLAPARTFGDVQVGAAFWYRNAGGLVEIAVNRGRADEILGLGVGSEVALE